MDVYARWTSLSRARILIVVASVMVACACVAASQSVSTTPDVTTCTPLVVQSKLSTLEYNSGGKRLVAIDDQPREDFVKRYKEGEDVAPKPRARGGWFGRRADATEEDPDEEEAPPPPPAPVSGDPTRYPVHVFDYSFRDTYIPYDIYPIRLDPLRRPLAKIGTLPVDSGVARVNGGGFSFDMKVWWPETGPSGCMPAVVILHPVQVFSAEAGESEYQQTCEHLASMNVICFISLESTGQFGSGTTRKEQTGLADRAMEMWNHIRRQSTIPSSPLYRRVCNKLGVTGYSMGSGSAALMASMYSQPRWGIKALGYIHGTLVGADKLRAIDVPTMIGGGTGDTLVNADRQFKNFDSATNRNPTIAVLLKGAPHVTGPCGNSCPVIQSCCRGTYFYGGHMQIVTGQFSAHTKWLIPFFFAYLKGDLEASRAIWETDQIENDDKVDHVLRSPRVAAALPTLVFENDEWVTAKSGATEAPAADGTVDAKPSRPDDSVIEVQSAQHTVSPILEVTAFTNATGLPYSLVLDGITTVARVRNALGRGADSDDSLCEDLLSVIPVPWASETPAMLQDEASQGATVNSIQESRFIEIRNELAAQTSLDVWVGRTVTDEEAAAAESAPQQEPDAPMYRRTWWGELVPIPTTPRVFYYDWSQPTTFYAAISSSCLPAHIKNITCSLRFRVVNEKDGATLSNPVTRLVRVAH